MGLGARSRNLDMKTVFRELSDEIGATPKGIEQRYYKLRKDSQEVKAKPNRIEVVNPIKESTRLNVVGKIETKFTERKSLTEVVKEVVKERDELQEKVEVLQKELDEIRNILGV